MCVNIKNASSFSIVLYIVCGFVMFVVDTISDHIAEAYANISFVSALYVDSIAMSFCVCPSRSLNIGIVFDALTYVLIVCLK